MARKMKPTRGKEKSTHAIPPAPPPPPLNLPPVKLPKLIKPLKKVTPEMILDGIREGRE